MFRRPSRLYRCSLKFISQSIRAMQLDKVGPSIVSIVHSSSMCRNRYFYFGLFYSMAIKLGMPVTDALLQLYIKFRTLISKYSKVAKLYMLTAAFSLKRTDRRVIIGSLILLLQFATHPVHKTW